MIKWTDALATGFDDIDLQHLALIKLINNLEEAVQLKESKDRDYVEGMLLFLEGYAKSHFSREERCMAEKKCPVAEANKQAHAQFLKDYRQLKQRFDEKQPTDELLRAMYDMTSRWITNHICGVDIRLREFAPIKG